MTGDGPGRPGRRAASTEAGPELRERLRRALFLIPYAVAHPRCTVEELARAARMSPGELIEEFRFLRLVGRPPFSPADLIDIDVSQGRVHVTLPQGLSRPPSLTPLEAAALDSAASALAAEGGEALARVRQKLRAALPAGSRRQFDSVAGRVVVEAGAADPGVARTIDRAIAEHLELDLTYYSAGSGRARRRSVRPIERILHQGYWYLHAFCCDRRDRRLFRLDRASDVVLTDRTFVPRPVDGRARFGGEAAGPAGGRVAEVRLAPGPWAEPAQARRLGAGEVEGSAVAGSTARFPVEGDAYLASIVLSLEGAAELLSPPELRRRIREAAEAAALRHRS